MHGLCSKTKYVRFHGTAVERDFVEAPSQMLENWCWDETILARLSSHVDTGKPLPSALIKKMVAARNVNAALLNLRQMFFGWFDMDVHTMEISDLDIEAHWHTLREEITMLPSVQGTWPAAAFGHIMGGYDAGTVLIS